MSMEFFLSQHQWGCAIGYGGEDHQQLARTLAGYANHPNVGGAIIVGLGCEAAQGQFIVDEYQLSNQQDASETIPIVHIQDQGGIKKTISHVTHQLMDLLPKVNEHARESVPASEIILATECGGSDGYSGITANPLIGKLSDLIVAHGGTSILGEVPEIIGGEHLLTQRAASPEIAEKLLARINWWHQYAQKFDLTIDNNPSYGNKQGGLTTIYEKSLGALLKGGSTTLNEVYEYAQQVSQKGFVVMDTPGYDPVSVTGMIAGGANLVVFSTGRGSCFGSKPAPTLKIATQTSLYNRLIDDMDFDAGRLLTGEKLGDLGEELFNDILNVASGEHTKSEAQGIGDEEFCPWHAGPIF